MNLEELFSKLAQEGKIRKQATDRSYLNGLLGSARQNFLAAKHNLNDFPETAFKSAYDGLLQISRTLLLDNGYQTDDGEQHKTTFLAAGVILGDRFKELVGRVDRYRIKRNQAVYQPIDFVSKSEAEAILQASGEYWRAVKSYLKEQDGQLELFNL